MIMQHAAKPAPPLNVEMARLGLLCLLSIASIVLACQPPDCNHEDCGSCGNACCVLQLRFALDPKTVNDAMVKSFKEGGADGRYTLVEADDYTKYNMSDGVKYMMQAIHTTKVHHYNDTLNFYVASNKTTETVVRASSISNVAGALCDEGQNYKNLVGYVKGLNVQFKAEAILGCPQTSPPK